MVVFPNCKINLGLHITKKRSDGFHNVETLFYPVQWCDALEVVENIGSEDPFVFSQSGLKIDGPQEENILYKCWKIMSAIRTIPPIRVHLHKNIPMGAGLGGGSSDAAFFINLLNEKFLLGLEHFEKLEIARSLGSDCAFFLKNVPAFAHGKGDKLSKYRIDLSDFYILLVYPGIHSNTGDAYSGLKLRPHPDKLKTILKNAAFADWSEVLVNDFEETIFTKYPEISEIKSTLYDHGAFYAGMSGSGSSVFAIFKREPQVTFPGNYSVYLQKPAAKIL